ESYSKDIHARYKEYLDNFNSLKLIKIADSIYINNHPSLLSCYKSEGKKLKELKKTIRDKQDKKIKGTCQYCGVLKPKTMDHYLPISLYPEFAVLAINLVPCCKDCNEKKKVYWKENGHRGIINFYIDNIPNEQFLYGEIQFVSGIPHAQYKVENLGGKIEYEFFKIVEKHYKRLELRELYKEESTTELGEIVRSVKNYADNPTVESIRKSLIKDASDLQQQYGINYWRAILRITVADSEETLNFILEEINEQ
ncbi:hypothetical protein VF12_41300, partial [Nostoc linckia z15]